MTKAGATDKRAKWSPKQQLALKDFYRGKQCVVTGDQDEERVAWHHLDENSSHSWVRNGVPISHGINQAIETKREPGLVPVAFDDLERAAIHSFDRGEYGASYGAARLGAFLAWSRRPPRSSMLDSDRVVTFSRYALNAVRALGRLDLAVDILQRNLLEPRRTTGMTLSSYSRGILALEIASVFWDYAAIDDFRRWATWARELISSGGHSLAVEIALSRLSWKALAVDIATGEVVDRDALVLASVREELSRIGPPNESLWLARRALAANDLDRAVDLLRPIASTSLHRYEIGRPMPVASWWTTIEATLTLSDAYARLGRKEADDLLAVALFNLQRSKIQVSLLDGLHRLVVEQQARFIPVSSLRLAVRDRKSLDRTSHIELKGPTLPSFRTTSAAIWDWLRKP